MVEEIQPTEDNPIAYKGRRSTRVYHTKRCCIVKQSDEGIFVPLSEIPNPDWYSLCNHCSDDVDKRSSAEQTHYAKSLRYDSGDLSVSEGEPQTDELEVSVEKMS